MLELSRQQMIIHHSSKISCFLNFIDRLDKHLQSCWLPATLLPPFSPPSKARSSRMTASVIDPTFGAVGKRLYRT
jgi:hypothetical protein